MHTITIVPVLTDNYSFIINNGRQSLIIDPGQAVPIADIIKQKQLTPEAILITHHHQDHCGGAAELKRQWNCPVFAADTTRVAVADHNLVDDQQLNFAAGRIDVLATPGHTRDHVCFYLPPTGDRSGALFAGDTLFAGGCGRLFENSAATMWRSLSRLAVLPDSTLIYCAHEYTVDNYLFAQFVLPDCADIANELKTAETLLQAGKPTIPTTLQREKAANIFLRCHDNQVKSALNMPTETDQSVFAALRKRKDDF